MACGYGFRARATRALRCAIAHRGMTSGGILAAGFLPELLQIRCPSLEERAQGMPGARCTRGLVCQKCAIGAHEHTGQRRALRHPLRNGFTAYFVLSPVSEFVLSPSTAG